MSKEVQIKTVIPEVQKPSLKKGKYDIHYVIALLRMIHDKADNMDKFSMKENLKRMIAMLEVERDQIKRNE